MEKEVLCCCTSTINLQGYIIIDAGCRIHGVRAKYLQPVEEYVEEAVAKQKSK